MNTLTEMSKKHIAYIKHETLIYINYLVVFP